MLQHLVLRLLASYTMILIGYTAFIFVAFVALIYALIIYMKGFPWDG